LSRNVVAGLGLAVMISDLSLLFGIESKIMTDILSGRRDSNAREPDPRS